MDFGLLRENNINVQNGLKYCGNENNYISTLQRFYRLYESNCKKMKEAIVIKELGEFTTLVHSLKSNSRMIGADTLSELAARLEMAGKEKDISFINDNFETMLAEYETVIGFIKSDIDMQPVKITGVVSEEEALLLIEKLCQTLDDYDGDASLPLMDELLKFPFRITVKNRLKEARTNIREYLFDEAYDIVKEAAKEIM